jgi:hypothetical protein
MKTRYHLKLCVVCKMSPCDAVDSFNLCQKCLSNYDRHADDVIEWAAKRARMFERRRARKTQSVREHYLSALRMGPG